MKTATDRIAQGDVFFRKVKAVPKDAVQNKAKGAHIVAHSETGHHHVVEEPGAQLFDVPGNPLVAYLQLGDACVAGGVDVVHQRPWDTHETIRLLGAPGDVWEIRRQREWEPEGWRRVQD